MKIDLFNTEEFIKLNNLQEITSGVLYQRGNVPHPNGLISNEIFGVSVRSRRETFAYIDLGGYYFHPHVYKAIRRMFRNIEKIINGSETYSIKDGSLVKDPNGQTGIKFIYDNWEKINWQYSDKAGMRNERVDLISKTPKNEIFTKYVIVIPPFYRDIQSTASGGGETSELNSYYSHLIRLATLVKDQGMFDFQLDATNYNIQNTLVEIYDYFKNKLEKKQGLFRKYLMGKTTDFASRVVITAPTFHANKPEDLVCDFEHAGVPVTLLCSLCYPFMVSWIKNFFEREVINAKYSKFLYDPERHEIAGTTQLKNPESYFDERYIKRMMDSYIKDQTSRFNKIAVPTVSGKQLYLHLSGKVLSTEDPSETSSIIDRPMTWTDLLYLAAVDVTKDKHILVTRYPLLDEFGTFINKIRVTSTTETDVVMINGKVYKWYPHVEFDLRPDEIGTKFIDSLTFSNSYLPGLDGDYDGDQITAKVVFTQEANEECEATMKSKSFFINASGSNIRKVENEVIQTFYVMTKEPTTKNVLGETTRKKFIDLKPEDITFSKLVDWFADLTDDSAGRNTTENNSQYNCQDIITINPKEYPGIKQTTTTTLGRLLFNKILIEGCGMAEVIGYSNIVLTEKDFGKLEARITDALKDDKITVEQMYKYVDTRDWLGLEFHSVITTSFTPGVIHVPPEVKALKKQLLTEHKKELEGGDERVAEDIANQLIAKTTECFKGDVGADLYLSGARGSLSNNYKNMYLFRGAVKNNNTGKYDILENSLMDGLQKKAITAHSNTILEGAYAKAVGTQEPGYLAKELLAALQTEVLDEEGSDCGTDKTLEVDITPANMYDFTYRYILEDGKLKLLTPDIIQSYAGKTVQMRSPMFCIGTKLCSKCAGEFYYKLGKENIGLVSTRVATTCTQLFMKKFHDNNVKTRQIKVDDMLL